MDKRQAARIELEKAEVVYPNGVRGLDGLDLTIEPGDFVIVVGLSGAGKSTLLRGVNGLVRLTGGDLRVGGASVRHAHGAELRRIRARIGMVFQDYRLVKRLRVVQNVLLGRLAYVPVWRSLFGLWPKADLDLALDCLDRVGIADRAWVKASQLSGGQQQRVGIARALAQEPSILLADEPVASLDPVTSHQVMGDLKRINEELGITTLINLHFIDMAREYGRRIVGLHQGKLVYDGLASEASDQDFARIYGRELTADDLLEAS